MFCLFICLCVLFICLFVCLFVCLCWSAQVLPKFDNEPNAYLCGLPNGIDDLSSYGPMYALSLSQSRTQKNINPSISIITFTLIYIHERGGLCLSKLLCVTYAGCDGRAEWYQLASEWLRLDGHACPELFSLCLHLPLWLSFVIWQGGSGLCLHPGCPQGDIGGSDDADH